MDLEEFFLLVIIIPMIGAFGGAAYEVYVFMSTPGAFWQADPYNLIYIANCALITFMPIIWLMVYRAINSIEDKMDNIK